MPKNFFATVILPDQRVNVVSLYPYQVVPDQWDDFCYEQSQQDFPEFLKTFYRQPLADDQQRVNTTEFVAIDIETTGMDAQRDDIVSIGLVPFNMSRIFLARAQYWVVRSRRLTSSSVVVHRITHSDVADAPSLRSILPKVAEQLQGRQVVVHYRYMEREFFRSAIAGLFGANWLFPVVDTLELESHYLRRERSLLAKWLQKPLPSVRLPNARERYHLPAYENHNALVDALATAELLQAQIAKQHLSELPVRTLWC
ncbi:MAG: 3'-5' exonuclease [Reinekea sp.]|nr:3'-5' exonuclease [Reinekea sp.]